MKNLALMLLFCPLFAFSQQQDFPGKWLGRWKGELSWFAGNSSEARKVNMELHIRPTDSTHRYSWQIMYGSAAEDNRPYLLIAKDAAKGHWVIDENNGIVLDQYWVANKFSGAFTVQNSTIVNSYWLEGDELHVEFYSISAKPVAVTGKGTEDSPSVSSFQVKSYQKAVLLRSE